MSPARFATMMKDTTAAHVTMAKTPLNIVLIGMPSAGKSTIGPMLAEALGFDFVDTDKLIEAAHQQPLQALVDAEGYLGLRRIESALVGKLQRQRTVIATGGSVVYSEAAMKHLGRDSWLVYLDLPLSVIEQRLGDAAQRGLSKAPCQTLRDIHEERDPLYRRYADQTVDAAGLNPAQTVAAIRRGLPATLTD